ncbi:MAG: HD-GYP domain-containing protein [Acidobacteriota bacterium]
MSIGRSEFQEIVAVLLAGQHALDLYPRGHPQIQQAIKDCYLRLRDLLQRERQIPIVLAGEEFVVGDFQVPIDGEILRELAQSLRDAGIEKLILLDGLRQWEIQFFLRLLNMEDEAIAQLGGIEQALEQEEIEHILAGPLNIEPSDELAPDLLVRAWEAYASGLKVVHKLRHAVRTKGRLEKVEETREFVNDLVEVGMRQTRPLLALHALKVHDEYSFTHSIDVATLTLAMAKGLNFGKFELREATLAALLHDIGKERVPSEVLLKSGKLSEEEWKLMERHTWEGVKMLAATPGVGDLAPIVAYEHHWSQRRDGSNSAKWPLHLVSELVTIADVYDALRSTRPYRDALHSDKAMNIMQEEAGAKFNPDLFAGFARMVGYYPPGTCVQLGEGEIGVVYQSNPDALKRPRILLVRDKQEQVLDPPRRIDLNEAGNGGYPYAIAEAVEAEAVGVDPFDYL